MHRKTPWQNAYETGADFWKTDVNATRDRRLVLFHDETLSRCTNVLSRFPSRSSYLVRDFFLGDIQSLDAGSYFTEADPFCQISAGNVTKKALSSFKKEPVPIPLISGIGPFRRIMSMPT